MSKNKNDAAVMAQFEENAKRPFGLRDKIGYAAAVAIVLFVIIFIFSTVLQKLEEKFTY